MQLARYHGLGNDYLVLQSGPPLSADLVRAVCDRHRGVGGDGILEPADRGPADHGVRIWNPDGSVAEKSGNGLRIYAQWLVDVGRAGTTFSVWTGSERVGCEVSPDLVTLEMGHARFEPAEIPTAAPGPLLDAPLPGIPLPATAVGLGNPHVVLFAPDPSLDALPWKAWGEALETDKLFPHRTNVQIAAVVGPGVAVARVWERGAGPTLASGSSACAVAAAAVRTGRLAPGVIEVRMPGGDLKVTVGPDFALTLAGPVERVGVIDVAPSWLAARR